MQLKPNYWNLLKQASKMEYESAADFYQSCCYSLLAQIIQEPTKMELRFLFLQELQKLYAEDLLLGLQLQSEFNYYNSRLSEYEN